MKNISVTQHNPLWPGLFESAAKEIQLALGAVCVSVQHIGSTSVPGLISKDIIDILCVVTALPRSLLLEHAGYTFKGEYNVPLRYYFTKRGSEPSINLHVVESDNGFIERNLLFRQYMSRHADARTAYNQLKEALLQDSSNQEKAGMFSGYNHGKYEFINDVLSKAGFESLTLNFCAHPQEWEAYHRIKDSEIIKPSGRVYDRDNPDLSADNHYHFVFYVGTKIVGIAHVELMNSSLAALRAIATHKPYQRHGFATKALRQIEKWIKYRGRSVIKLHAALEALTFYRRLGYSDVSFAEDTQLPLQPYQDLGKQLNV